MRLTGHRPTTLSNREPAEDPAKTFDSLTRKFLSSPRASQLKCPTCGSIIDFNAGVRWPGPDTFTCSACERHLSIRLIHRALRDLGIEP